ncbi:hypothetical protein B0T25DRAFT_541815 [Lasiosphaeria hispida]|uniref:Uncharacterized protein n=1 Tax=Lasiosphaeria hispida TaxID=260671 RepID=A0AAJ0HHA1_9PEZI|nr:hypothetical protein B0T25DRAFT_541815 [Lasiosphaeria hispida]
MRGLSSLFLLAPALAGADTPFSQQDGSVVSTNIRLQPTFDVWTFTQDELNFKFDVSESDEACGEANVAINGVALSGDGQGTLNLDIDYQVVAGWKSTCSALDEEQSVTLSLESVDGEAVKDLGFTVRFRQTAPVEIYAVEWTTGLVLVDGPGVQAQEPVEEIELTSEEFHRELQNDLAELEFLKLQVAELEHEIAFKVQHFSGVSPADEGDNDDDDTCEGLACYLKDLFNKIIGAGHPKHGKPHFRWPFPHHGNHSNHTFPHHGNHTWPGHGNHTHGNHTHGNHTFPHPPWRRPHHPPPFWRCAPRHGPPHRGPPGDHKPPHHGPPGDDKPPHHGPPHHAPPGDDEPPRRGPPAEKPPMWWPEVEEGQVEEGQVEEGQVEEGPRASQQPHGHCRHQFRHHGPPVVVKLIFWAAILFVVVRIVKRCRSPEARAKRAARREMCRQRRAAFRARCRRFFGRTSRPASSVGCARCAEGEEKEGLLAEERVAMMEEKMLIDIEGSEDGEELTMEEELASFRAAADIVGQLVAAEEGRSLVQAQKNGEGGAPPAYEKM